MSRFPSTLRSSSSPPPPAPRNGDDDEVPGNLIPPLSFESCRERHQRYFIEIPPGTFWYFIVMEIDVRPNGRQRRTEKGAKFSLPACDLRHSLSCDLGGATSGRRGALRALKWIDSRLQRGKDAHHGDWVYSTLNTTVINNAWTFYFARWALTIAACLPWKRRLLATRWLTILFFV